MEKGYWRRVCSRAFANTRKDLGLESGKQIVIKVTITLAIVAALALWGSEGASRDEMLAGSAIVAVILLLFPMFFVGHFVCVPPKLAAEAEARLRDAMDNEFTGVPTAHLGAMQRYEGTVAELQNKVTALSALVEQARRLLEAADQHARFQGGRADGETVRAIHDLIHAQMGRFTIALPSAPREGLRIQIGWNYFIQIFDVPMGRPPQITITGLPDSSHAELSNVTELSFEVRFWPDRPEVTNFGFEANSRL